MNQHDSALAVSDAITITPSSATLPSAVTETRVLAPTRARVGSKREELLRCAREQFAARGFVATPIAAVASSVHIRKSTFFHYFQDKDALYDAAVRAILDELAISIADAPKPQASYVERLDALVAHVWRFLAAEPSLPRLLLRSVVDEPMPEAPRPTALDRIVGTFAETIQRGVDEGVLAICDPTQEAMGVVTFLCAHATSDSALTVPVAKEQLIGMTNELRLVRMQQRARALLPPR
jgi:AcrR family transcriptional regulator